MADGLFNVARGKYGYYGGPGIDGAANGGFVAVPLSANEAEATLVDRLTLAAVLAEAGTTELTTGGWTRKSHAAADVTFTQDDTANSAKVVIGTDDTWTAVSAGTAVKLLICWDPDTTAGTDTDIIPLSHHDFSVVANGGDITADYSQTNGVWASS